MLEITVTEPLLRVGCILGEGPIYDPETHTLHFIDIKDGKVFHLNTDTNELQSAKLAEPLSCIALRKDGKGLACTPASGFAILEQDNTLRYLTRPNPPSRFNDGACDSHGRFFVGTVNEPKEVPGRLYRYDPNADSGRGTVVIVDEGPFTDSNGMAWSQDEKTFYFTDSQNNIIYQYDYDIESGELSNRRVFVNSSKLGVPGNSDGLCIDTTGGLWSARWEGSQLVRFAPDGTVDVVIHFPTVWRVTASCFAGNRLYVTTAHCSVNGTDEMQEKYPDSGHLFMVDLEGKFKGVARHPF
ncbi:hypothetical protein FISHEDRAFT_46133 [Fistulina hepatica ATCC 64428]|uniref:SMP-30/Gluconolactonase/LRE-like region domain-containing protein n=1 Tax=Fistulina hepatica ATCC 64428 TaxID=1128425 RepID=A0A0D7A8H6_9AGAR|nr:hypothetical protein FISHEDRAFT_46133 [Fistulina hepatica ATCC 64428]